MGSQQALFPSDGREMGQREPEGFRYQAEFIKSAEETALVSSISQLDLKPFEFHGYFGNRRVVNFGFRYNFNQRSVEQAETIPPFLRDLLIRAAAFAEQDHDAIRQVGINEYRTGAGIGWHKDKQEFGIIAGISLGSSAVMRFRRKLGNGRQRVSWTLDPRSIYLLSGAARSEWEHSISPCNGLRYSITMRTLADAHT
jgi:alkylated DNA repair dioxygenase AlkB